MSGGGIRAVFMVAQMVKNVPAIWETRVRSPGREDPPEKAMAPHSTRLENSMDRGAWWPTVHGVSESKTQVSN